MFSYSPSVHLVWQLAAMETAYAGLAFIEVEQVFLGLLKVADVLEPQLRDGGDPAIARADLELIEKDLLPMGLLFTQVGLNRTQLRRHLRFLAGKGDQPREQPIVHRSDRCKGFFKRAEDIARAGRSLSLRPLHLLEAILEAPGQKITLAVAHVGLDLDLIKQAAANIAAAGEADKLEQIRDRQSTLSTRTPHLDRFGLDLTRLAAEGRIEPLIGRQDELLRVIRTLTRKSKNNPVLIGDPGVGKTAIARGLASRIAHGNVTPDLHGKRLIELNMAGLVAGTKYRGEFEKRLLGVLDEVRANADVLLFIDELHTLIAAGAAAGAMDAANIMKPALAAGEVRCIGATTWQEYHRHIEQDAALERRFQPITVAEPSAQQALAILEGLKERYEAHHRVAITAPALEAAVQLSVRHLPERFLPDKAIDLIDEACSRVKVQSLSYHGAASDLAAGALQVTERTVAGVLADWTGRPVEAPGFEERGRLAAMEEILRQRVIGQDHALQKVAQVVRLARAGMRDPNRPMGVLLFLGPSGVGKTELARALAEFLFGGEGAMVRLDMSEYLEKHSVARLIGAPPGYVGYAEEGQLSGGLRRRPHTVVLLDELEKAHPEVLDLFLQLFDEGRITDARGHTVNAKDALFVMTSNLACERPGKAPVGFEAHAEQNHARNLLAELKDRLRPELLNRIDEVIVFRRLGNEELAGVVALQLAKLRARLEAQSISLEVDQAAIELLSVVGCDPAYGARRLARTMETLLSKPIADQIIHGKIAPGAVIRVLVQDNKIVITT